MHYRLYISWAIKSFEDTNPFFRQNNRLRLIVGKTLTNSDEHKNKAYNITGPAAISNYEIADILSNIAEKKVTYVDVSVNDTRNVMKNAGMQEWGVDALMELFEFQKAGNASVISPDVERVVGRKPISFTQFATDYAQSFRTS